MSSRSNRPEIKHGLRLQVYNGISRPYNKVYPVTLLPSYPVYPLKTKTAEEVAHHLLHISLPFGAPAILHSDKLI